MTALLVPPETRYAETRLELRDSEVIGKPYKYLHGRAVPYETWADIGWFLEQFAAGSFRQSTSTGGKHAPLLLFHDNRAFPIGMLDSAKHAADGFDGVWKLNETAEAQRAAGHADAGELVGLSVGFAPIRSDWTYVEDWNPDLGADHKDRVVRIEARLIEVSLTPTPAYEDAGVSQVRTAWSVEARHEQAAAAGRPRAVDAWRAELARIQSQTP
jgi:HK97 family phage prohead protease